MAPVFPDDAGDCGGCVSAHDLDRYRHRDHLRVGGPGSELAPHRRDRRRRSKTAWKALLVIPASSLLMIVINLGILAAAR